MKYKYKYPPFPHLIRSKFSVKVNSSCENWRASTMSFSVLRCGVRGDLDSLKVKWPHDIEVVRELRDHLESFFLKWHWQTAIFSFLK